MPEARSTSATELSRRMWVSYRVCTADTGSPHFGAFKVIPIKHPEISPVAGTVMIHPK
jgi:hypothetical protein